ncbi:MAG: hypothetical protein KatS3mg087_1144 [Patescibacteria group bacterium]|nr:MAG: hypothetical protein KatS3mg087_1144 [Patescibacteria group bacterium]
MPRECVVKLVLEIFKSNNLVNLSKELDESIYKTFFLYAELCNTLLDQDRDANERWKTFTNSDDLKSLIDKHFCNLDLFDALVRSGIIVLEGTRAAFLNLFSYKHFLWVMRKRKYRNKLSQLGLKEKRAISSSTKSVDDANLTSTIASEKELLALYNRKLQEEAQGNHKFTKRKEDRKPLASPPAQCNVNATNMVSHTVRDTPPVLSHTVRDTCNNGQSVRIVTPAQRNTTPPKGMSHTVRDTPPVLSHTVRDTCHERSKKSVVTPELPYSDPPKVCLTQCVTQPPFCLTQCVTQAENRLEDPRPADFASERADLRKESERERKRRTKERKRKSKKRKRV